MCYENIFNSDLTKFKKKRYASWERKGVKFIGDLYENNRLMTWHQFKEKFNINCVPLEYQGLLHSLPAFLKKQQSPGWDMQPALPARVQYILNNKTFTRYFTKIAGSDTKAHEDIARIERKWISDNGDFEKLSVYNIEKGLNMSGTRYISFHFKLIMRILTTNVFLNIINVQENNKCSFCDLEPETLKHLFVMCPVVDRFWDDVSHFMSSNRFGHLSNKTKLFGHNELPMITHCVTVAKYVIYEARRAQKLPLFIHFKTCLSRDFVTEEYIARKNGKTEKFREKWKSLDTCLRTNNESSIIA